MSEKPDGYSRLATIAIILILVFGIGMMVVRDIKKAPERGEAPGASSTH